MNWEDDFGNIYIGFYLRNTMSKRYSDFTGFWYKYNDKMELKALCVIKTNEFDVVFSKSGNIYQIDWDPKNIQNGVRVIKWQSVK